VDHHQTLLLGCIAQYITKAAAKKKAISTILSFVLVPDFDAGLGAGTSMALGPVGSRWL
jgi:hypothetical protein